MVTQLFGTVSTWKILKHPLWLSLAEAERLDEQ
jgi:hypothetical protein